jgi:hypothetical protein
MTSEAECWLNLGRRLGVEVVAPIEVRVGGDQMHFTALLPQFGAPLGMLVDSDSDLMWGRRDELVAARYGFSCVVCTESEIDLESVREMLADWGWSSDQPKPDWLRS